MDLLKKLFLDKWSNGLRNHGSIAIFTSRHKRCKLDQINVNISCFFSFSIAIVQKSRHISNTSISIYAGKQIRRYIRM